MADAEVCGKEMGMYAPHEMDRNHAGSGALVCREAEGIFWSARVSMEQASGPLCDVKWSSW